MARTAQFNLPLVMPSQAQKHVTVNEALVRLDAVAQLRVLSGSLASPPATATDGQAYIIPINAEATWLGRAGQIAVWSNGGWVYLEAKQGWRAWNEASSARLFYDGIAWKSDVLAASAGGATTESFIREFDHVLTAGATNTTSTTIPSGVQVLGVTGRVMQQVSGSGVTGWRVGVAGSDNRYASGVGVSAGSYLLGLSGTPVTYYENTPLLLTAESGAFAGGRLRLAIHAVRISPPREA